MHRFIAVYGEEGHVQMLFSLPLQVGLKTHGLHRHSGEKWDGGKRKPSFLLYQIVNAAATAIQKHFLAHISMLSTAQKDSREIQFLFVGSSQYQGHFDGHEN